MKKLVLVLSLVAVFAFVNVASAATLAEQIAALQAQLATLMAQAGGTVASSVPTITSSLTIGSKGEQVEALQQYLEDEGLLVMPAGTAYGYFGPLTKAAVVEWQKANDVSPASGYFGPISRAALAALASSAPATGGTLPAGCAAGAAYSSTTGAPCNGTSPVVGLDQKDGSLTITSSSVVTSSQTLKKGDQDKPIIAAHVLATAGNVSINRFDVHFNYRPWLVFSKLTLKDNAGAVIAEKVLTGASDATEVSVGSDYMVRFDGVNYVVAEGQAKDLVVSASVLSASDKITGQTVTVTIPSGSIRTINGVGYSDTPTIAGTITTGYSVVLSSTGSVGDLYSRISPTTPDQQTLSVSSTSITPDVVLGAFDIKLMNNPGTISTMVFNINDDITGYNGTTLMQNVRLYDGGTLLAGAASMTAANPSVVTFSNMNLNIPTTDSWKTLVLKADILATSTSFTASSTMDVSEIVGTDTNYNTITLTNASDRTSNDITFLPNAGVAVSGITVSKGSVTTPSTGAWLAAYPYLTFTLTNTGSNPIYISKVSNTALATTTSGSVAASSTVSSVVASGSTTGDTADSYIVNGSRTFTYNYTIDNTNGTTASKKLSITGIYYGTSASAGVQGSSGNAAYGITYGLENLYVQVP